jgi:hypothetical protein
MLLRFPPPLEKGDQVASLNQMRSPIVGDWQFTLLDPGADRVPVNVQPGGGFLDGIAAQRLDPPPVGPAIAFHSPANRLISARRCLTFHAVVRGPSFTGLGYRPFLTPCSMRFTAWAITGVPRFTDSGLSPQPCSTKWAITTIGLNGNSRMTSETRSAPRTIMRNISPSVGE